MLRILIAEDEPPLQRALIRMIGEAGADYIVTGTAMNGKKALELLKEQPADVIFSDVRMPVMDGLELAEAVRREFPAVEVVMVTGYQEFQYVQRALQSRVYDYITKPVARVTMESLLQRLDRELAARRREEKRHLLQRALQGLSVSAEAEQPCYALLLACAGLVATLLYLLF